MMNEVLPGLYVGGLRSANDEKQLTENSIKAIVSIHSGPGIHNFSDKYAVLHLTLDDSTEENVTKHFTTVNSFVHEFRLRKENVLIHCLVGVSRSVCFCIAYLMTVTNLNYSNAMMFIKKKRLCANPNYGFRKQLGKFGEKLILEEKRLFFENFAKTQLDNLIELYNKDCLFANCLPLNDESNIITFLSILGYKKEEEKEKEEKE
uniref:Dual specificity protein phosphatase n=1 Tax=Meloidogyne incognita TaxID=6306 RepID=A0A914KGY2_MELIC